MRKLAHLVLVLCLTAGAVQAADSQNAGIGIALGVEGQYIVVKRIFPDTPAAAQKDIHVSDRITAIAQEQGPAVVIQGGKLAQAVSLIRGPKGSTVRLTLVPAGQEDSQARVVSLVRGDIKELAAWGDGALLTNGTPAPDIELTAMAGQKTERLSEYAGKTRVLEFWATWCGPCQAKMGELQRYSAQHPEWNGKVVIIAASVDESADTAARHLKAKGWNQTHNVWVGIPAKKAYHIAGIPTVYLIDPQGKVAATNPRDLAESVNHELQRVPATGAN